MRIAFASDKPGFVLKNALLAHVRENGHDAIDVGTTSLDNICPFTTGAFRVANAIQNEEADRGILICGTGMGMAITANKFKGVYAAAVESTYAAEFCRKLNDANVLCLGGFFLGETLAKDMVDIFLETEFTQSFEAWRVELLEGQKQALAAIEAEHCV